MGGSRVGTTASVTWSTTSRPAWVWVSAASSLRGCGFALRRAECGPAPGPARQASTSAGVARISTGAGPFTVSSSVEGGARRRSAARRQAAVDPLAMALCVQQATMSRKGSTGEVVASKWTPTRPPVNCGTLGHAPEGRRIGLRRPGLHLYLDTSPVDGESRVPQFGSSTAQTHSPVMRAWTTMLKCLRRSLPDTCSSGGPRRRPG